MKKMILVLISMLAVFMIAGCSSGDNGGTASQNETTTAEQSTTQDAAGNGTETAASQQNVISEAKAKEIALKKVKGASETDIVKFKLEADDGRQEYEGEIRYSEREYDFEIDAVTGDILSWEEESVYN